MGIRSSLTLTIGDCLEKRHIGSFYRQFKNTEFVSHEILFETQKKSLRRLMQHAAATVPYYRYLFKEAGINPAAENPLPELWRIPPLSKEALKHSFQELISSAYRDKDLIPHATGGSTGVPTRFLLTKEQHDARAAVSLKAYQMTGWDFGVPTAFLSGEPIERSKRDNLKARLKGLLLNQRYFSSFNMSEEKLHLIVRELVRMRPRVLFGYVSAVNGLCEFLDSRSIKLEVPVIVQMAEMIYPHQQEFIEHVLGGRFFKHYGARDAIAMGIECRERAGLHVNMDTLLVEILKDGRNAGSEEGEVVVTDLFSFGMPLIRYRIGDVARCKEGKCACGRQTPLFEVTQGRTTSIIVTRDGGRVPGLFFPHLVKEVSAEVRSYQIWQPDIDHLVLRIVRRDSYAPATEDYLLRKVRERVGNKIEITFDYVPEIKAEASGKYLFVKSAVAANFGND